MTAKSRATLLADYAANVPDNHTARVTPAKMRQSLIDAADSALFPEDMPAIKAALATNVQTVTTSTYTITQADNGQIKRFDGPTEFLVTVPNGLTLPFDVGIVHTGFFGSVTLVTAGGVVIEPGSLLRTSGEAPLHLTALWANHYSLSGTARAAASVDLTKIVDKAAARSILFGSAMSPNSDFGGDGNAVQDLHTAQIRSLTTFNSTKWSFIEPSAPVGGVHTYDWTNADKAANYARTHGKLFRNGPAIWHGSVPSFGAAALLADLEGTMRGIFQALTRYSDITTHLEVLNEVLNDDGGTNTGIANRVTSPFYIAAGNSMAYCVTAMQLARQYFPNAELSMGDFAVEQGTWVKAKRDAWLDLLQYMIANGAKPDAINLQTHFFTAADGLEFDIDGLARFILNVNNLGIKVNISEMDWKVQSGDLIDTPEFDAASVQITTDFMTPWLKLGAGDFLQMWGLYDFSNVRRPFKADLTRSIRGDALYAALNTVATQRVPSTYNLFLDGGFSSALNTNWSSLVWTISGGKARCNSVGDFVSLGQTRVPVVEGGQYTLAVNWNRTAGGVRFQMAGGPTTAELAIASAGSSGSFSGTIIAPPGVTTCYFQSVPGGFNGDLDDSSLTRTG